MICPSCGWEIPSGNRFCGNCGTPADGTAPAPANPPVAESAPATDPAASAPTAPAAPGALDVARLVADDGRRFTALAGNPAAQLAAVRNALAVAALDPDAVPAARRAELLRRETELFAALSRSDEPCPLCHGVGTVQDKTAPAARPGAGTIESVAVVHNDPRTAKRTCPLCGGRGASPRVRDRRTLAGTLGLGRRDYARAAQADGLESFHDVLLPRGGAEALSLAARTALLRGAAFAFACRTCAGTGTVPCRDCSGFGRIACDNADFHRPPAARTAASGRAGSAVRIEDNLLDSPAAGRETCPVCGGRRAAPGAVSCRACGGRGLAVCAACDGTGHAPECRKCRGEGLAECRRCNGTGRNSRTGADCDACAGAGRLLCDSCGGTGHGH